MKPCPNLTFIRPLATLETWGNLDQPHRSVIQCVGTCPNSLSSKQTSNSLTIHNYLSPPLAHFFEVPCPHPFLAGCHVLFTHIPNGLLRPYTRYKITALSLNLLSPDLFSFYTLSSPAYIVYFISTLFGALYGKSIYNEMNSNRYASNVCRIR